MEKIMRFTKMHGIGNDYVFVNCFVEKVLEPEELAPIISDRHFGIGSDGLILVMPSETADVRMRMFNADGSESEMCGNGIRCVAKFAYEYDLTKGSTPTRNLFDHFTHTSPASRTGTDQVRQITVQTGRGVLTLELAVSNGKVTSICVDMGQPILLPNDIPVSVIGQQAVGIPLRIEGYDLLMTCVSMGNPHAIFYTKDVAAVELERVGPAIETHEMFPKRVNVHFVQVLNPNEVIMRTWERGSGVTLACGTGASAVCVAGILASKTERNILAHLPGGDLQLFWNQEDNHLYMAGPAVEVFNGNWPG